jgi:flagellar biosynthesis protein FliQ
VVRGVPFPGHAEAPAGAPDDPNSRPLPMPHALVVDLARNAVMLCLLLSAPLLAVALVVGLVISVLQAVTQIQEQTLSFVPKLFAVAAVFLVALPWLLQMMVKYTTELFRSIPTLVS